MRAVICLLAALGAGCGAAAPDCPDSPAPRATDLDATQAKPLPSQPGYRMLLAVDRATPPEVFWGLYYGAVAMGWRVTVAGEAPDQYPVTGPIDAMKPAEHDVLVVPSDVDVSTLAPYFGFVATVGQGERWLAQAGTGLSPDGTPTQFTRLTVATPGEVPLLLHQLQTYAADRLRVRHQATGGHPP